MNNTQSQQIEELKSSFPFNWIYMLGTISLKGALLISKKMIGEDRIKEFVYRFKKPNSEVSSEDTKNEPLKLSKKEELNPFITGWSYRHKEKIEMTDLYETMYNTLVLGSTGAGKSTFLERLIFDKMINSESVMFLDPKGDIDLFRRLRRLAVCCGYKIIAVGSTNFIDDDVDVSPENFDDEIDFIALKEKYGRIS